MPNYISVGGVFTLIQVDKDGNEIIVIASNNLPIPSPIGAESEESNESNVG